MRRRFGLRDDPEWVDWVAEHGIDGGTIMRLGIHPSPGEVAELEARDERHRSISEALAAAQLSSGAGRWIDQEAGGVMGVLLAHPDQAELALAEQITAAHDGRSTSSSTPPANSKKSRT